jgi:two-component system response regulator YesN
LAFFDQCNADAIFTDIRMPGMSGIELIAAIKEKKAEVECVIVSAYSDFEAARRALEHRASGYLLKPLEETEVREAAVRGKARLDARGQKSEPLRIDGPESLASAIHRLEGITGQSWSCIALYSGKARPNFVPDCTEILIKGSPVNAVVLSAPGKTSPGQGKNSGVAFSRWHEGCSALAEMLWEASASGCGAFAYAGHKTVSDIQYYIARHYQDNFSLGDLALRFSISESYLGELFKKHTGDTIINFTRMVRLENACRLLAYGSQPLKKVAEECGFCDVSYFGRSFNRRFGITPARFQARFSGGLETWRPNFCLPGFSGD